MTYDFETMPDRRGTNAEALDLIGRKGAPGAPKDGFDAIPMWVADMNFATSLFQTNTMIPSSAGRISATGLPAWKESISAMKTASWAASYPP